MPICFAVVRPDHSSSSASRRGCTRSRTGFRGGSRSTRSGSGQPQVAPHGVAADPHLPGGLPPAQTFDQHLVSQHVHVFHSEHPFPQSPRPRRRRCWDTPRNGSPSER